MPEIELSAGTIEYEDSGGDGPVALLLHGLMMDSTLWRNVVRELAPDHRCVAPTLPLGGHRRPMRDDADLSMRGIALLVGELMEKLDLRDVTFVMSDWGGELLLLSEPPAERIARLVLCSCEAFDNVPPGLPGRMIVLAARLPGGLNAAVQPLRLRALRRTPATFGWMSKRPVPDDVMDRWLAPILGQRAIRRDLLKYVRGAKRYRPELVAATEALRSFDRPALVAWAAEDRVMPREHGPRLAELLPLGRLVEIPDSYTLVSEDQPALLARSIRELVRDTQAVPS